MLACQVGGCKNSLSSGEIALIIIDAIAVVIIIVSLIYKLIKKKKSN